MFRASVKHQDFLVAKVLLQIRDIVTDGILQPESEGHGSIINGPTWFERSPVSA
jgi:hypothetical protein